MAFVSLSADHSAVIAVYGSAQCAPTPPGYAVIADDDTRLQAFSHAPPDITPVITASYNASLRRQADELAARGKTAEATALYLKAAGVLS